MESAAGHGGVGILLTLFIVYVAAQIGAEVAGRLRLPSVVGEIAAGCLVGPSVLNWVHINEPLEVLAEIGAVLLLFSVGLETRLADLRRVGRSAALVGVLGVIFPFALGAFWAYFSGFETAKALFVAAAFVATSAGITARVLSDLGVLGRTESRVILGAAVIDDILAMLLLGVVTALQGDGGTRSIDWVQLGLVLVQAIGFIVIVALVGTRIIRKRSRLLDLPIHPLSPLTLSLALCLGLAAAAANLGLAAIIGAFLAGTVLAESQQRLALERQIQPIMAFVVPFFFVVTGAQIDLKALSNGPALLSLGIVTALAVVSKLVGGGLGALSLGKRRALIVGWGMVPRGEVGIIVASLGRDAGVFTGRTYALIIAMSLLTSVIAPPVLNFLLAKEKAKDSEPPPSPDTSEDGHEDGSEPFHLHRVDECGYDRPAAEVRRS
ncbi:MAG: cation:proton antiporter [Capsulimonadales bacterium]|nr:cation:proton antiporter [Capsulimonadales bacterium]